MKYLIWVLAILAVALLGLAACLPRPQMSVYEECIKSGGMMMAVFVKVEHVAEIRRVGCFYENDPLFKADSVTTPDQIGNYY